MVYTIILYSTNDIIAIYPHLFRSRTTYFKKPQKAISINNQAINFYKHVIISIFVHIKYAILRVKSTGVKYHKTINIPMSYQGNLFIEIA